MEPLLTDRVSRIWKRAPSQSLSKLFPGQFDFLVHSAAVTESTNALFIVAFFLSSLLILLTSVESSLLHLILPQDVSPGNDHSQPPQLTLPRYAFRRSASRFLTARPSTFLPSTRSYISIAPLPKRAVKQTSVTLLARRWASTDEQQAAEAPISKLQPTGPEEVENAIHEDTGAPSSTPPAVAESANLTEATEETIPAAEIQEQPSLTQGITADQGTAQSGATGESEPGYGPNGFSKKPTIYIGNLFFDVTESDLVKEFTQFGTITKCKIIRDSRGLSKGYATEDSDCSSDFVG